MTVAAVVLAAGMSSRMGTLKQLIQVGDRSLLQTTLDTLNESAAREIVIVLGHEADRIRQSIRLTPTTKLVINPDYREGMSASIKAGLGVVSSEASAALIVLADQPLLKSSVIDSLIAEHEKARASIVIPVYKGFRGNPVLIGRSLFPEMMQISGDIGCRSLFGLHPEEIHKVEVDDIGILVDIDTADDLKKLSSPALANVDVRDRAETDSSRRSIVIFGNDELVSALTILAKVLKLHVIIVDPLVSSQDQPEADRIINEMKLPPVSADCAIVVASRGKYDEEALEQAVKSNAGYIALMGSKKRGAELMERLKSKGMDKEALRRIHSPAGLAIGAETPEEIALSIMAEIIQTVKAPGR